MVVVETHSSVLIRVLCYEFCLLDDDECCWCRAGAAASAGAAAAAVLVDFLPAKDGVAAADCAAVDEGISENVVFMALGYRRRHHRRPLASLLKYSS